MVTTKKWCGRAADPPLVPPPGIRGCLAVLFGIVLLVGCSPPGRQNLLRGEQLIRENRPADAIPLLQEAVAQLATNAPACAQAWNYLGLAYHYAGQANEAAQAYQNALTKDFNLVVTRFNRGCLFLELNNLPGAINELTTYTTHQPKDALGWTKLGTAQLRARLLEPAERSFQRVLELNPGPDQAAETMNNLGMIHALRRRPSDAFRYFNAALKQRTNHPPALLNQAIVAQQQLNDRALALQRYRAYLDAAGSPANSDAVAKVADQIEAELFPRPATTNLALTAVVVTNPPPPRAANEPLASRVAPTPNPAVTNPPVTTGQPETATAPAQTNLARSTTPGTTPPSALTATASTNVATPPTRAPVPQPPAATTTTTASTPAAAPANASPTLAQSQPPAASAPEPKPEPGVESPPPPMEVVQIQSEPEVQTAQDLAVPARTSPPAPAPSPSPSPSAAPPRPAATGDNPPSALPASAAVKPAADAEPADSKPKKKSFVQKLNPLGWFGGKEKKEPVGKTEPPPTSPPTPQEPTRVASRAAPTTTTSTPVAVAAPPAAPPAPPPAPTYPRYHYLRPALPAAGDRARAQELMAQGIQAHKSGRINQALPAYRQAVQADPSCFEAQYNLGVAAFDAGTWTEALAAFEQALVLKPDDANARLNFALALDRANYPLDAAQELERLLAQAPDTIDAHATAANLYAQKLEDPAKARSHYTKVLQLNPRHPQAAAIRRWLATHQGPP